MNSLLTSRYRQKAVLHVIDSTTRFSLAIFDAYGATYEESVKGIWLAFVDACCSAVGTFANEGGNFALQKALCPSPPGCSRPSFRIAERDRAGRG